MKEKIKYFAERAGLYLNDFPNRDKIANVLDNIGLTAPLVVTAIAYCAPKDVFDFYGSIAGVLNLQTLGDLANFLKEEAITHSNDFKASLIVKTVAAMPMAIPAFVASASLENAIAHFRGMGGDGLSNKLIEYSKR